MKLPDFTQFEPLNKLREAMGAELVNRLTLTKDEIKRLEETGIEIPLDEVRFLEDGSLAYKNSRVILYIRDVSQYQNRPIENSLPRFHVSYCKTLESMFSKNRRERYVVTTRDDGLFALNIISGTRPEPRTERLNVCQFCLDKLYWQKFRFGKGSKNLRKTIVSGFLLSAFFTKYPKSPITEVPSHTEATAPINNYPDNFEGIVKRKKNERGHHCEKCTLDLSAQAHRRFLHAHHINGQKNDNTDSNIMLLCLGCHASQPMHGHMKSHPDYQEFIRVFRRGSNQ